MSEQFDLHDCEKTVFSGWDEETTYLERVTITDEAEARSFLANELCVGEDDLQLQPVHMRWETPAPGEKFEFEGYEYDGGWSVCDADHPDAVPFWRDAP